jgi:hypothetical protein
MEQAVAANMLAYAALLVWPLVSLLLFRFRPTSEAVIWTILGAFLFLPSEVSIKIPLVPAIDKDSVASIAACLGCLLFAKGRHRPFKLHSVMILALLFVLGPVITSALNSDAVVVGERILPAVGYYDGVSAMLRQVILLLPFLIGVHFLRTAEDGQKILRALVVAGLLFTLPALFEIRMSPNLSMWIYGYFHSFATEARYGGFRPVVFMDNGLVASFFLSTSFLAAVALWRLKLSVWHSPPAGIVGYLGIVLVLCKSAGALVYAAVIGFCLRYLRPVWQLRVASILVCIALSYPMLRLIDWFPTAKLVDVAATVNNERADSLKLRFDQEQKLLEHASERLFFGWGRYGRNRVYDESGKDTSITDGLWIIILGQFGLVGFIAQFGLLVMPVFRARRVLTLMTNSRDKLVLSTLSLLVAITVVEQLPNSSINGWSWLLAGALLGQASSAMRARPRTLSGRQLGHDPRTPSSHSAERTFLGASSLLKRS